MGTQWSLSLAVIQNPDYTLTMTGTITICPVVQIFRYKEMPSAALLPLGSPFVRPRSADKRQINPSGRPEISGDHVQVGARRGVTKEAACSDGRNTAHRRAAGPSHGGEFLRMRN
jgi:hypothetical protein